MTEDVRLGTLEIDPDGMVSAKISEQLGGRHVDLRLRFHLKDISEQRGDNLREIALLEIQQILRYASNVTLEPELGA